MQIAQTKALPPAQLDKNQKALQSACKQFEGYFLDLMFKEMRKTVPKSGLMGDQSNQQGIFTQMMDQSLADSMSKRGGLGIGKMLYDQLSPAISGPEPVMNDPTETRKKDQ